MVQFNFSERTIKAKVVYYGPAQSGKTTNLERIHALTDPAGNNRLISLNTAQDRTLFFDLLPFSLGTVSGYDFKVQLYTVPGQVQYNATRRVVLAGADAVVFVADSRKSMFKENVSAFENMKVNLLANRLVPEKVSLVLQFNKQDLPDLQSEAELARALNPWGRRAFPAVASGGQGVLETFVAVVQEMLAAIAVKYNLKEKGLDPVAVPDIVAAAFSSLLSKAAASAPPGGAPAPAARVVLAQASDSDRGAPLQVSTEGGQVSEELLHRAIRSNVELAEVLAGLVKDVNTGLSTIASHAELLAVYRDEAREKRAGSIRTIQEEAARLRKVMEQIGNPSPTTTPAPPAVPEPSAPPRGAAPLPVAGPGPFETAVRAALQDARDLQDGQHLDVELRIPPGAELPRCPPEGLSRALASLFSGTSAVAPVGSSAVLRCERKPVLLKGRDGQVKRDFLMVALAHSALLEADVQQRISQGAEPGPLGEMGRLVREMGGFVRFAPLAAGGQETRLFLPAQ